MSSLPPTDSTPEQRVLATKALRDSALNDMTVYAGQAQRHLDTGDFSAAATACHRAHQQKLIVNALGEVLR